MSYLQELLAGYAAGLAIPQQQSLKILQAALRSASGAEEHGRLLGCIAVCLTCQAHPPASGPLSDFSAAKVHVFSVTPTLTA